MKADPALSSSAKVLLAGVVENTLSICKLITRENIFACRCSLTYTPAKIEKSKDFEEAEDFLEAFRPRYLE